MPSRVGINRTLPVQNRLKIARAAFCALTAGFSFLATFTGVEGQAPKWVGSWTASPCAPDSVEPRSDQFILQADTVRQVVHLSIGGVAVRVRMSNVFGTAPLALQSVFVGPRKQNSEVEAVKPVTFGGKTEISIPPGASVMSDPVEMATTANSDFTVSYYVAAKTVAPAIHYTALQTSFVAKGDQASALTLEAARKTTLDLIVTAVDVATRTSPGAIVAIGSSTTDGAHSTSNANHRWTDYLSTQLREAKGADAPSVLNAGISGNRVLHDGRGSWGPIFGVSAVARFDRDVLAQSGVKYVVIFEGGNDIRQTSADTPSSEMVSAKQLIMGFQLLIREAHERKLKVILGTITPFQQPDESRPDFAAWEESRQVVNEWIRKTKDADGVVDLDVAIRDPQVPARILPMFDSGDHLHPNDSGYKAMASAIDLKLFQ